MKEAVDFFDDDKRNGQMNQGKVNNKKKPLESIR